jgi:hypothetical protein
MNDRNLKQFLSKKALLCVTQKREEYSTKNINTGEEGDKFFTFISVYLFFLYFNTLQNTGVTNSYS